MAGTSEDDLGSDQPTLSVPGEETSLQVDPEVTETSDESSEVGEDSETVEPALPAPEADQPPVGDLRAGLALLARTRTLELLATLGAEDTPVRYRTLATQLGTTMLATRLRELTAAGLVLRHVDTGPPIEVSYALSPTAAPLTGPVRELLAWAGTYTPPRQAPHRPEPGDE
ncbi:winged helix-turn-helix transcriptional regulator, partial [Parafrankia discariae]|uniref:winged helix-turn-helix transcriptional regulator n=1 Tax=Parafrankia discariae TaxID=365528 RepID=UPI001E3A3D1F